MKRNMKKILLPLMMLCTSAGLTACNSTLSNPFFGSSNTAIQAPAKPSEAATQGPGNIGGSIGQSMDSVDKEKFSHALDKPLGKPTQWTNAVSGINYTVTPQKKVEVANSPYCREYSLQQEKDGQTHEFNGTACVDASSNWQPLK